MKKLKKIRKAIAFAKELTKIGMVIMFVSITAVELIGSPKVPSMYPVTKRR